MGSATKTPNYGLSQWQGNEYPNRTDFVSDNTIIDIELKKGEDHRNDTVAHMTKDRKDQLAAAVQSATVNGGTVPKSGTTLQLPAYPVIPGSLPANGGTATYAHYPSHAVGLADFGLRGNFISSASPSGGNDGDTWDQV